MLASYIKACQLDPPSRFTRAILESRPQKDASKNHKYQFCLREEIGEDVYRHPRIDQIQVTVSFFYRFNGHGLTKDVSLCGFTGRIYNVHAYALNLLRTLPSHPVRYRSCQYAPASFLCGSRMQVSKITLSRDAICSRLSLVSHMEIGFVQVRQ